MMMSVSVRSYALLFGWRFDYTVYLMDSIALVALSLKVLLAIFGIFLSFFYVMIYNNDEFCPRFGSVFLFASVRMCFPVY